MLRLLERKLYECPEVTDPDALGIPETSEEVFQTMAAAFFADTTAVHIFPFVNKALSGGPYVDVYIWDYMMFPRKYKRFVVISGYGMTEADECEFLRYTHGAYYCEDAAVRDAFCEEVQETFPEWHFKAENAGSIGRVLEHLYFASHRSGPKEILYKADLNHIAEHLIRIPDYNLIGTTPEDIIGHGLPLRLLRILNQEALVSRLYDKNSIGRARAAYEKYGGYLGKTMPSAGQWQYLEALSAADGIFQGEGFNRALYERLAMCSTDVQLLAYKEYLALRKAMPELKKRKFPGPEDIGDAVEKLKRIRKYCTECPDEDRKIRRRGRQTAYNYSADGYSVMIPGSVRAICMEAYHQGNCLMDYISDHAEGKTTILFLRKTEAPDQSFVTMEVKERQITQVYGRFNKLPEAAVFAFLEKYAQKAWLYFNPYTVIMQAFDDLPPDDWDDALFAYAEDYKRRITRASFEWPDDDMFYEQLTLF